jgi:glycosyltransferase involved in cell wall biosynthesis
VAGDVEFLGHLDPQTLRESMRSARALVVPSRSEGLGRVVVEAMACGTPVVATRVGGIPELVVDGETGWLVPADDPSALADVLAGLGNERATAAMGARAREWVRGRFSRECWAEAQRRLVSLALGERDDRRPDMREDGVRAIHA